MSFQLGATATKHTEIRKALETQRDQQLRANRQVTPETAATLRAQTEELESDLADAAIAGAEAAARKLKGAGNYQVTVSGQQNYDGDGNPGGGAVSISVNANP